MELARQVVRGKPELPPGPERQRIARLLFEETMETIAALGVDVFIDHEGAGPIRVDRNHSFCVIGDETPNLVEVADGVADMIYVGLCGANACGIDMEPICEAIWSANLRKFSGDAHLGEDGKWKKPTGFVDADVKALLELQCGN